MFLAEDTALLSCHRCFATAQRETCSGVPQFGVLCGFSSSSQLQLERGARGHLRSGFQVSFPYLKLIKCFRRVLAVGLSGAAVLKPFGSYSNARSGNKLPLI